MSRSRTKTRHLTFACLLITLLFSQSAYTQVESDIRASTVDPDVVNLKIAEVEASTTLDEQVSGTLLDLYRRTLTNLEIARVEQESTNALEKAADDAPEELQTVNKAIQELRNSTAEESLNISENTRLSTLEQKLSEEKASLSASETRVSQLRDQYIREVSRPGQVRDRISVARQERDKSLEEANAPAAIGELNEINEARRWRLETNAQRLTAELRKLEQELLTHDVRLSLLIAQQEYASLHLELIQSQERQLEDAISARRNAEAEIAMSAAEAAQQDLETQHPSVQKLAEMNVELGNQLTQRSDEIAETSDLRDSTRKQLARLSEELDSTRNKLAIAGINQALGQLLVDQKRALPSVRAMQRGANERKKKVADVGLQQIQLNEQRRDLREIDDYVASLTADLPPGEAEAVQDELKPLAEARRELLDQSIEASSRYLGVLGELHLAQNQLTDAVINYSEFLNSKLLWVRNSATINPGVLLTIPSDFQRLVSRSNWKLFRDDFSSAARDKPYSVMVLAILLLLGLMRHRFLTLLDACSRSVGKISVDRFSKSVKAVVYTALASMPLPIFLILTSALVSAYPDSAPFSEAISTAIRPVGLNLIIILFMLDACREHGLLRVHCNWTNFTVDKLHIEHHRLLLVLPAATLLGHTNFILDSNGAIGGLAVISTIISAAAVSIFVVRLLTPAGGVLRDYLRTRPSTLLEQTRPLWTVVISLIVPSLLALWLAGYNYTGYVLAESFMYSFWLVLWLMVLQSLLARWLALGYQRLELKAAIERRDAAREARLEAQGLPEIENPIDEVELDVEEPRVDFDVLSNNSRVLLKTAMIFIAVFWLWLIWAPIIPALNILEEIALWTRSGAVSGEVVQIPVTLADLLFAIILLISTFAAAKGIPALVQLLMLQRKTITAGERYTVTTLLRYAIIGIGGISAISMLGISWAKAQWLVAALGVGIGFGLQEIVANFISGIVILFERPIRVGDVVTVGETSGVVTRIQIRATTIRDWDRRELLVPNKEFITGRLLNWSLSDEMTRVVISVGIAYGSDVMLAMKLTEESASEHPEVLNDPAPFVIFEGFGSDALKIVLRAYLPSMEQRLRTISDLNQSINQKFAESGISVAFPQRDVHLDSRGPLEVRLTPAVDSS